MKERSTKICLRADAKCSRMLQRKRACAPCPFNAGFFITIPCENDDAVNEELFKDNIFAIAIGGGIRIAISAISEDACRIVPAKVAAAIKRVNG